MCQGAKLWKCFPICVLGLAAVTLLELIVGLWPKAHNQGSSKHGCFCHNFPKILFMLMLHASQQWTWLPCRQCLLCHCLPFLTNNSCPSCCSHPPPAPFHHPFDFLPSFLCAVACVFLLKTELRGGP